jgi:HSP20 family protein
MIGKKAWWFSFALGLLLLSPLQAKEDVKSPFARDEIFQEFQKLQQEMNRVFEKFDKRLFSEGLVNPFFDDFTLSSVRADMKDRGDSYEIKVDLPGSKDANINVKVEGNLLQIDAKVEKQQQKKGEHYIKRERVLNSFHRTLTLPKDADSDKLKSDYKEGVLTVIIPKKR